MSEKIVTAAQNQIVTVDDFNNIGLFGRDAMDHIVKDAVTDLAGYIKLAVVQSGPAEVTVSGGRLYRDGKVYSRDDDNSATIDLVSLLPAVTKRIVTVVVWGNAVDAETEARTFLLDAVTRTTEARIVSTENHRVANIDRVAGTENVDPQPPALDANVLGVAYVTLNTTGIEKIEMIEANRLISLKSLNTRLTIVEKRLDLAGSQIDTLRTDLSGLALATRGKAPMEMVVNLAGDFARVKRLSELPDNYTNWSADNFANEGQSDTAHGEYDCKVKNGLFFKDAARSVAGLALVNPLDERITVIDNMVMPRHDLIKRLSVSGNDGEVALATFTSSSTDVVKLSRSRSEWEMVDFQLADDFTPQLNDGTWRESTQHFDYFGNDVVRTLERIDPVTEDVVETWEYNWAENHQLNMGPSGQTMSKVRTYHWTHRKLRTFDEPYFDKVTSQETVQGFQIGSTFLNAQEGALGRVNLFFTRKAESGDVHVYLTETDASGRPDPTRVLHKITKTPAELNADLSGLTPTSFDVEAASLVKGRLYGIWVVSQGSHFLSTVSGNKYAQGAFFQRNGADWVPAAADVDLAMELWFNGYRHTRVEVQLDACELAGGIEQLLINCDTSVPDGTTIVIEGLIGGTWKVLSGGNPTLASALSTRPSIVQLKAVLVGTTDAMPAFGIGNSRSSMIAARGDTNLDHISGVRTLTAPCDTVEVVLRAKHWDDDDHTLTCKILVGGSYDTVEAVDVTTDLEEPETLDKLKSKKFVFNLAAPVSSYKIQIDGDTTDVLN
ncbi:hypothetical protein, partial [Maritalea porphyrae]|uniref:hypothetical protein n=1 Tax=Maritalea porphyrae TaxID=880732 RepID=UPI0022AE8B39